MRELWKDEDVLRLQEQLRRVLRALRHRRHGLHPAIVDAMRIRRLGPRHVAALAVVARDEGLSVGDLAERLGVSLTAASLMASELNMATLVERVEDQTDRRRTLIYVAERWRPWVRDWLDDRARPLRSALDRLEPAQRAALAAGLTALAEELEAAAPAVSRRRAKKTA
ncbi:MAG: MarR family winged helix-turn-helix transcriptional regulator [Gaiellaceae bacterium]